MTLYMITFMEAFENALDDYSKIYNNKTYY